MSKDSSVSVSIGFPIGGLIAAFLSWKTWASVGWAVIHFLFGWWYVIYWLIRYLEGK